MRLVDRIAYINHDIDDALRAGVLAADELPAEEIAVLGDAGRSGSTRSCTTSSSTPRRPGTSCRASEVGGGDARLRTFMFDQVYLGERARAEHAKIARVIRTLFDHYCEHPAELPPTSTRRRSAVGAGHRLPGRA